ncbi:mevalonate kinase [Neolewinella xylanilytica]|uniref:Mevalonate kinase n=1 Tax=Neolewinella xylanilytica TaxID=1514080 RepID=A0A2S6I1E6_9BACT|nr:hypothetical protein [Neolewinella xylanilytica]PPK84789.1 mevalonate kinase [Neolewinella xylanilytica]
MKEAFPAKLLLFGEHTVLRGGRGLAVPYDRFRLRWARDDEPDDRLRNLAAALGQLELPLQFDRLVGELEAGWQLAGDIPLGYGLGSSGAVCAAVFDRYALPEARNRTTAELRTTLAQMESYFHGSSSGTDPLLAYLQQPLLLGGDGSAGVTELPEGWDSGWFLLDTGATRSGSPYIQQFLEAYERDAAAIRSGWLEPADRAIAALMTGNRGAVYRNLVTLSDFQLARFPEFIPAPFRSLWDGGATYRLKLCGAGGGGMVLGLAEEIDRTRQLLGKQAIWLADPA